MPDSIEKYLELVSKAALQSTLVKMTLSKPAQKHDELRNIYVKPVLIRRNAFLPLLITMSVVMR